MAITQTNVNTAIAFFAARVGNVYVFGGMFSPTSLKDGTDCSGECDTILRILTTGNGGPVDANGDFIRTVDTESWDYNYPADLAVAVGTVGPYGTICAGDAQPGPAPTVYPPQIPSNAAAVIYLMHDGGGVDSHMMIAVNDGSGNYIVMETGGDHNDTGGNPPYQSPNGPATSTTDPEWTDIWYLPGSGAPVTPPPPVLTQQQQYAITIINTGVSMGVTPLGCQMALACGLDESSLRVLANTNVPASSGFPNDGTGNNGESCGIFQQQVQDGWGTLACEMDVACSAGLFFTALLAVDNGSYNSGALPPWQYIQNVQGSATADGSNYEAQWNAAVALYNSVINITPPTPGGFLMALTDAQQTQLFNAICGPVASQSPFRALGEGAVWEENEIVLNDDSFEHPQYVAWAAAHGDQVQTAILTKIATADVTLYPDRAPDILLAQNVLAGLGNPTPAPVTPTPVTPTPAPAPVVLPPGTFSITQILTWGKDLLTILGPLITYVTATHAAVPTPAAAVPAAVTVAAMGLVGHTVHNKRVATKQLLMKGNTR